MPSIERVRGGRSTHPVSPTAASLDSPTSAQPGPLHAARRPHDLTPAPTPPPAHGTRAARSCFLRASLRTSQATVSRRNAVHVEPQCPQRVAALALIGRGRRGRASFRSKRGELGKPRRHLLPVGVAFLELRNCSFDAGCLRSRIGGLVALLLASASVSESDTSSSASELRCEPASLMSESACGSDESRRLPGRQTG